MNKKASKHPCPKPNSHPSVRYDQASACFKFCTQESIALHEAITHLHVLPRTRILEIYLNALKATYVLYAAVPRALALPVGRRFVSVTASSAERHHCQSAKHRSNMYLMHQAILFLLYKTCRHMTTRRSYHLFPEPGFNDKYKK